MTPQEIVNFVAEALRKQGRPAMDSNCICMLRGSYGTKCAFGWLIPDEDYAKWMEKINALDDAYVVEGIVELAKFRQDFSCVEKLLNREVTSADFCLFADLQHAHDTASCDSLRFYEGFVAHYNQTRSGRHYPIEVPNAQA